MCPEKERGKASSIAVVDLHAGKVVSINHLVFWVLSAGTPHISSEAPNQYTSAWAVTGVAITAVLVFLVMAVVQSAFIWYLRR